jgi:tRNA A-37 threonylcarbamoyl transferase component Bud32
VADKRETSGRRLPLPPPTEVDDTAGRVRVSRSRLPVPRSPQEMPRLPEVGMFEESSEIDLDDVSVTPPPEAYPSMPQRGPISQRLPLPPTARRTPNVAPSPPHAQAHQHGSRPQHQERPTQPGLRGARTPIPRGPAPRSSSSERRPVTQDREALIGGRYKVVERIGQGGMGKVYKVIHAQLGKTFALKIISEGMAETDEARQLFYREARMASSLSHPNITSVVDFGEDDRVGVFMVMELVEGEALVKVLHREKQLSVHRACDIAHQVAEALHYIHENDIVHCDIKTENILLVDSQIGKRRQLVVKLLDFGLARSLVASRNSQTLSGTPHYVAPERIRGEPASPSSDVYSLGILLYEMLTGKVPWDGPVQHILSGHLEEPPKPPSQLRADGLDPALERMILRSLGKRPSERHKDMAAFLYELRTVMDMLGFGRRRAGKATRIVVEKVTGGRDELARLTLDACRLPTALLSSEGRILLANPAFAKFVMGVAVEIEGLAVKSTPLATAWTSLDNDIARTLAGQPIRRLIEIDVKGGEVRRLLLWLDAVDAERVVVGVHPVDL